MKIIRSTNMSFKTLLFPDVQCSKQKVSNVWHDSVTFVSSKSKSFKGVTIEQAYVKQTNTKLHNMKHTCFG